MIDYTIIPISKECIVETLKSNNCMTVLARTSESARDLYTKHINFDLNETVLLIFPSYYGYLSPIDGREIMLLNALSKGYIQGNHIHRHGELSKTNV